MCAYVLFFKSSQVSMMGGNHVCVRVCVCVLGAKEKQSPMESSPKGPVMRIAGDFRRHCNNINDKARPDGSTPVRSRTLIGDLWLKT